MATFSLAHAKEAADTDYDGRDLAVFSKHDVIDLADRLVGGIRDLRADELAGAHLTWLMRVELTIGGGGRARLCLGFGRLRDLGDASSWATLFGAGKAPRLSHRPGVLLLVGTRDDNCNWVRKSFGVADRGFLGFSM